MKMEANINADVPRTPPIIAIVRGGVREWDVWSVVIAVDERFVCEPVAVAEIDVVDLGRVVGKLSGISISK